MTASLGHEDLKALVTSYFTAVDDRDLEKTLSLFAPDAIFTVKTDHVTLTGHDEIRSMFVNFLRSKSMLHDVQHIVVDERARKVSTEQRYTGELEDGTKLDMQNCNFFDIGEDGRFTRVVIWMAGSNPLKPQ